MTIWSSQYFTHTVCKCKTQSGLISPIIILPFPFHPSYEWSHSLWDASEPGPLSCVGPRDQCRSPSQGYHSLFPVKTKLLIRTAGRKQSKGTLLLHLFSTNKDYFFTSYFGCPMIVGNITFGRPWSANPAFIKPDPVSRTMGVLKSVICNHIVKKIISLFESNEQQWWRE